VVCGAPTVVDAYAVRAGPGLASRGWAGHGTEGQGTARDLLRPRFEYGNIARGGALETGRTAALSKGTISQPVPPKLNTEPARYPGGACRRGERAGVFVLRLPCP
jgi:hypothetical protein